MSVQSNMYVWGSAVLLSAFLVAPVLAQVSYTNRGPASDRELRDERNDDLAVNNGEGGGEVAEAHGDGGIGEVPGRPQRNNDLMTSNAGGDESAFGPDNQTLPARPDHHLSPWTEPDGDPASEVTPDDVSSCPSDCAEGDGFVDVADLLRLLSEWGTKGPHDCDIAGANPAADDTVGVDDLLVLLAGWGDCPD